MSYKTLSNTWLNNYIEPYNPFTGSYSMWVSRLPYNAILESGGVRASPPMSVSWVGNGSVVGGTVRSNPFTASSCSRKNTNMSI